MALAEDRPLVFTAHAFGGMPRGRLAALRFVITRAQASVVLSQEEADWQKGVAQADTPRVVIPNGIDEALFRYRRRPTSTARSACFSSDN